MINCLSSVKKKNEPDLPPEDYWTLSFVLKSCILLLFGFTDFIISYSLILSNIRIRWKIFGANDVIYIFTLTYSKCRLSWFVYCCGIDYSSIYRLFDELNVPNISDFEEKSYKLLVYEITEFFLFCMIFYLIALSFYIFLVIFSIYNSLFNELNLFFPKIYKFLLWK